MKCRSHVVLDTSAQDLLGLVVREETGVAKHVAQGRIDQIERAGSRNGRHHCLNNVCSSFFVALILRSCVCPTKVGNDRHWMRFAGGVDDAQYFEFRFEIKTVATLDFDSSSSFEQHGVQALA